MSENKVNYMNKTEKSSIKAHKTIRIFIYIIQLFILASIQQVPGFIPEIYGGRPLLILPLILTVALLEGNYVGFIFSLVSGIIMDLSLGNHIGVQLFVIGIIGYILGKVKEKLFKDSVFTFIFFCILIEPFFIIMRFYLNQGIFVVNQEHIKLMFINHIIPGVLYTICISPVIYLFNRPIFYFIREKEAEQN